MISTIILSDKEEKVLKNYLEEQVEFRVLAETDDSDKIYDAVKELSSAVLFVNLDFIEEDFHFISSLTDRYKDLRIIAYTQTPSVDLMIKTLRAGASALLSVPFLKSEFDTAIDKVKNELLHKQKEKSKCRIITVFSNKGGIGKTSIATNLALELAKITKENVALVDLNFQLGDITAFLDLKPSFNISYMLHTLEILPQRGLFGKLYLDSYFHSLVYYGIWILFLRAILFRLLCLRAPVLVVVRLLFVVVVYHYLRNLLGNNRCTVPGSKRFLFRCLKQLLFLAHLSDKLGFPCFAAYPWYLGLDAHNCFLHRKKLRQIPGWFVPGSSRMLR